MEEVRQAIPEVEVQVGDRKYKIKCSFGLLARFQKATGLNPFDQAIWQEPSPVLFASLIWAGVVRQNPKLTLDDVAEMLSLDQARQVNYIINALMSEATSEKKEEAPAQAIAENQPATVG